MDVSQRMRCSRPLGGSNLDELHDSQRRRIELLQGALTYRDRRLEGFDAAVLMEVIEHLDPPRLTALEQNVFGSARPGDGRGHHAQRRVQPALGDAARGRVPSHRSPFRVDVARSSPAGVTGLRSVTAIRFAIGRSATRTRRSVRRPRWRCSAR